MKLHWSKSSLRMSSSNSQMVKIICFVTSGSYYFWQSISSIHVIMTEWTQGRMFGRAMSEKNAWPSWHPVDVKIKWSENQSIKLNILLKRDWDEWHKIACNFITTFRNWSFSCRNKWNFIKIFRTMIFCKKKTVKSNNCVIMVNDICNAYFFF